MDTRIALGADRRQSLRFDKMFTVYLATDDGLMRGLARNISATGLFVETPQALPIGGQVRVTFTSEESVEMTCICEVRYQVALNFSGASGREGRRGAGLRIIAYDERSAGDLFFVDRERTLH